MNKFPKLTEIVPEYHSKNALVRWFFVKRLTTAIDIAQLETDASLSILDLGCGNGELLHRLRKLYPNHNLTGIDHNPMVSTIAIASVAIKCVDITEEKCLPSNSFDRIFCMDVMEHIRELKTPLQSIHYSLKPDGLLIISAPTENIFCKCCRFILKGTFSEKKGPAAGPHFHQTYSLRRAILNEGFIHEKSVSLPLPGYLGLNIVSVFHN